MRTIIALVLALLSVTGYMQFVQASDCQTGRSEPGTCIPLMECGYFTKLTDKYGTVLPHQEIEYLTSSFCNRQDGTIHICCVSEDSNSGEVAKEDPIEKGMAVLKRTDCGDSSGDRVAFGTEVDIGEFPWMALLQYDTPIHPFKCGGSLITNRYVLTAAHCIVKGEKLISVRLGEHNIDEPVDCQMRGKKRVCSPPAIDYEVDKTIVHESYKGIYNDVALVRLKREVKFTNEIKPVCLPITPQSKAISSNQEYYLAGWGGTENGVSSKVLLKALINHVDLAVCRMTYRAYNINDNHLCVGGLNKKASCRGDSGGPLFFLNQYENLPRYIQYGIVSQGVKTCGSRELAGVYANVIKYIPWIAKNLV